MTNDWIGRERRRRMVIDRAPAERLAAALDLPVPGEVLPEGWHWASLADAVPQSALGEDGHPTRGDFLPPIPLPRRMFAGAHMEFRRPVRIGREAELVERIASVQAKAGRSGELVFVTVERTLAQGGEAALTETQNLVYRGAEAPAPVKVDIRPPQEADWRREVRPDPTLLFRFSAATFNSHRIHYDLPYATSVEGYPGLVVHGPLIALLLLESARAAAVGRRISAFSFRAESPLFSPAPFSVCGRFEGEGAALWAEGSAGRRAMSAEIVLTQGDG